MKHAARIKGLVRSTVIAVSGFYVGQGMASEQDAATILHNFDQIAAAVAAIAATGHSVLTRDKKIGYGDAE